MNREIAGSEKSSNANAAAAERFLTRALPKEEGTTANVFTYLRIQIYLTQIGLTQREGRREGGHSHLWQTCEVFRKTKTTMKKKKKKKES